ncbi:Alpha/beta hydrolase domain-containing protein 17C [Durusdinium trenchii]|uniref:Alpha/beta hydrolase domain-containing protein 17C n=1 Tax=Durusdinium trenchii TaxID=1381693 RepID=A0ABP0J362_9DINO
MAKDVDQLPRTPEEASRTCTDFCCVLVFAGILADAGLCCSHAIQDGNFQRLQSLPDFQGRQCLDKFVFFPLRNGDLDLHRHVCVETCPTSSDSTVTTYLKPDTSIRRLGTLLAAIPMGDAAPETNSLLRPPGQALPSPDVPIAVQETFATSLPPNADLPLTDVPNAPQNTQTAASVDPKTDLRPPDVPNAAPNTQTAAISVSPKTDSPPPDVSNAAKNTQTAATSVDPRTDLQPPDVPKAAQNTQTAATSVDLKTDSPPQHVPNAAKQDQTAATSVTPQGGLPPDVPKSAQHSETVAKLLGPSIAATTMLPGLDSSAIPVAEMTEPELQEVSFAGYRSFPVAGILCMPDGASEEVVDLAHRNWALLLVLQVSDLWHHKELLLVATVLSVILVLVFLCAVETCAVLLTNAAISALVIIPGLFGGLLLHKEQQGQMPQAAEDLGVASYLGIVNGHGLIIGIAGVAASCIVLACACFQCGKCAEAATAVQEAADCLMTMPSLLLEPLVSLLAKLPIGAAGCMVFLMLITSGDYGVSVDLTQPQSLFHPSFLSSASAVYFLFAWLVTMEVLHYISVFIVIYVAEVWFFKHYKCAKRGGFCEMCGSTLILKGTAAAMKHLGSLIYASILMAILRPIRWVMKAFLAAEEVASYNDGAACILAAATWFVDSFLEVIQRILELTSQVAFMHMATDGTEGYCESTSYACEVIFNKAGKWTAVEGVGTMFVALGVGSIAAGTGFLVWLLTKTLDRYTDVDSGQYVSDPDSMALASGLIGLVMSLCFLHHFQTITDTIVYCRGLVAHRDGVEKDVDEHYSHCWDCCCRDESHETERLLKK